MYNAPVADSLIYEFAIVEYISNLGSPVPPPNLNTSSLPGLPPDKPNIIFSPPVVSPCANTCDNVGVEAPLPLDAPVTCPFASTVTVALVYEPAVTPELSCVIVTDPVEPPPPIGEVVDTFVTVSYTHLTLPTKA